MERRPHCAVAMVSTCRSGHAPHDGSLSSQRPMGRRFALSRSPRTRLSTVGEISASRPPVRVPCRGSCARLVRRAAWLQRLYTMRHYTLTPFHADKHRSGLPAALRPPFEYGSRGSAPPRVGEEVSSSAALIARVGSVASSGSSAPASPRRATCQSPPPTRRRSGRDRYLPPSP